MAHTLPWGASTLSLDLPPGWDVLATATPKILPGVDAQREVDRALANPVGAPPLRDLARGKKRVVVVVDDVSRPTPAHLYMPGVLREMEAAGVDPGEVWVIPGLGVHRAMSAAEMEAKLGPESLRRVKWENHEGRNPDKLARLGETKRGTPVVLNRRVAEADLVVLLGTIEPHVQAGFGGGLKNVLPGVAALETIAKNHLLSATEECFTYIGEDPDRNPMRLDLEEAGSMLPGDLFLVNGVLNPRREVVRLFAGHPVRAHREGCGLAREMYGVRIPRQADVVIADSHPMDIDIRQSIKCIANTIAAARPGGALVALARCEEGLGEFREKVMKARVPPNLELRKIVPGLKHKDILNFAKMLQMGVEDQFFIYIGVQAIKRNPLYFYAPTITPEEAARFPLFEHFTDPRKTVERVAKDHPRASVLIFPQGGVTYPILS